MPQKHPHDSKEEIGASELNRAGEKRTDRRDEEKREKEMLVGRGKEYVVDEIVSVQKGDLSPVSESIVYILEEV
ncbi:MAG TPA: hypothetical protein O0Y15_01435 [Methanocorpusculum sp.]|nr:hypothetical protein [Methanocorpusculum sp.]